MPESRTLNRWLGPLTIAASCCGLLSCGHEPASIILEYEVDQDAMPGETAVKTDMLVAPINARLGKAGRARVSEKGHIEVDIFGKVDQRELELIERRIESLGILELRIMANIKDHTEEIATAKENAAKSVERDGRIVTRWVALDPKKFPGGMASDHFIIRSDGQGGTEVLVMIDSYDVTSKYLSWVGSAFDQRGRPAVDFSLGSLGADRLGQLTTENQPDSETGFSRHLGIVFDDELISATALRSVITKKGQISGKFTMDEVDSIITILNAGSLPFRIRQVSRQSVAE